MNTPPMALSHDRIARFLSLVNASSFCIRVIASALVICGIAWCTLVTSDLGLDRTVSAQSLAQRNYRYRVRGRVVDQYGRPVSHAIVVVDAGLPTTWEDFTYSVESDETGKFLF